MTNPFTQSGNFIDRLFHRSANIIMRSFLRCLDMKIGKFLKNIHGLLVDSFHEPANIGDV